MNREEYIANLQEDVTEFIDESWEYLQDDWDFRDEDDYRDMVYRVIEECYYGRVTGNEPLVGSYYCNSYKAMEAAIDMLKDDDFLITIKEQNGYSFPQEITKNDGTIDWEKADVIIRCTLLYDIYDFICGKIKEKIDES